MENEFCENCGRAIGKLEQAFVYKDHIVCKECNEKLGDEPQEIPHGLLKAKQTADVLNAHIPKPLPHERKSLRIIGSLLIILSVILGIEIESVAVFGLFFVPGVFTLIHERTAKKTRSETFWLAFAGWTVLFAVLILSMLAFYAHDRTREYDYDRFDPSAAAAGIWFFVLAIIWFLGALPLFISAIVTRKDKK